MMPDLADGAFAENLVTSGVDLGQVKVGDKVTIGDGVLLEVTQIGKECHQGCAIRQITGDCIMPREGIFCRVLKGGRIRARRFRGPGRHPLIHGTPRDRRDRRHPGRRPFHPVRQRQGPGPLAGAPLVDHVLDRLPTDRAGHGSGPAPRTGRWRLARASPPSTTIPSRATAPCAG